MAALPLLLAAMLSMGCLGDYVPPEAVHNVAHVKFPQDALAAQNLRVLGEQYGIPNNYHRCSSLIGPQCASDAALAEDKDSLLHFGSDDPDSDLSLKVIVKKAKPGQTLDEFLLEMASMETEPIMLNQESATLAAGEDKEDTAGIAEELRRMMSDRGDADMTDEEREIYTNFINLLDHDIFKEVLEKLIDQNPELFDYSFDGGNERAREEVIVKEPTKKKENENDVDKIDGLKDELKQSRRLLKSAKELIEEMKRLLRGSDGTYEDEDDEYEDVELEGGN